MPIIPKVGRKAFSTRLLIAALYLTLGLGSVTMVYPFLLMLATSITSSTDTNEFRIVPRYLYQEQPLFAKYVDDKYEGDIGLINTLYHTDFKKADAVAPPGPNDRTKDADLVREWRAFSRALPVEFKQVGFRGYGQHFSRLIYDYKAYVRRLFHNDVQALNRSYTEENDTFDTVRPPMERSTKRSWSPDSSPKMRDFQAWKKTLPDHMLRVVGAEPLFANYLREDVLAYGGDIKKARPVWGDRRAFDDIPLAATAPTHAGQRRDWEQFVRTKLPLRYLDPLPEAVGPYRAFLKSKYGDIAKVNELYETRHAGFSTVALPKQLPDTGILLADWGEFIGKVIPAELLRVDTPENRFREHLAAQRKQTVTDPVPPARLMTLSPPEYLSDALYVEKHAGELRRHYATRNYRQVLDYILLHGRSLMVTATFCLLVILTTLIVNPLCAYALSRYSLPYAYKVLLFLLATMAFPAEVAMIPNFLLLKELGLLNTYWALILPGMASGFAIFLLKGFFDSLPKELYEAGTIDGASDTRMFFNITLPLSKPIFAVIALQAFTAAYGAFMFALLVCQNPKMWTLMVWLYELQITNPQYIMMAALAVAAVPTLLVFVFAQNVIMRGIILPSYK
jgi:ABC-type glycerol-3-phosphate transport system permease component